MTEPLYDCLVIGGGPAGLTAALYLARFHLSLKVVDAGDSRAAMIPCTRNHAGFPDGISGEELLARMRAQAEKYGATIARGRVTRLDRVEDGFSAEWGSGTAGARTILLATGVKNRRPLIDEALHDEAVARGLIRYCPICDGFEVTDRKVGVIGDGTRGLAEAVFLRGYSADISLIAPDAPHEYDAADRAQIDRLGITLIDGPCQPIEIDDNSIRVTTAEGEHRFDSVYPALGSDTRVELARQVGAKLAGETSCITVDAHQRTSIPGLYAAGDVVIGLDQISHAMGEGGVAATTIRNDLANKRPLLR